MTNRRNLRESVLKAIYAYTLGSDDAAYVIGTIIKPDAGDNPEDLKFAEDLFLKTIRLSGEFDSLITSRIKNWELSRIALVDKIILWMSICEFLHFEEIPTKVTINEAIEIAKEYSTAKSGKFVNGVLDAILDDLKADDRIQKTGMGLLDATPNKMHPKS